MSSVYLSDDQGNLKKIANTTPNAAKGIDDQLNSESTNPVQNKVLYNPVAFAERERLKSETEGAIVHRNHIEKELNELSENTITNRVVTKKFNEIQPSVNFAESERQKTLNLFDVNTITRGYSLSSATGETLSDSIWYVSDYINVQGLSSVIISGLRDSGQSNCFYDASKTFISTYKAITGYIPVPSNAVYMRINGLISQLGDGYTNISQGDIVHNTIIQGMNGIVLWENPNKKAAFAPQVITLSNNLANFDYCALEYETVVPYNEVINCRQYTYFRPIVGGNVENLQGGWDSGTRYLKARAFRVLTETTIDMYAAYQEGTNDDRMMVPLRIIGYKKGV